MDSPSSPRPIHTETEGPKGVSIPEPHKAGSLFLAL
jgi:hypothetical protein